MRNNLNRDSDASSQNFCAEYSSVLDKLSQELVIHDHTFFSNIERKPRVLNTNLYDIKLQVLALIFILIQKRK